MFHPDITGISLIFNDLDGFELFSRLQFRLQSAFLQLSTILVSC